MFTIIHVIYECIKKGSLIEDNPLLTRWGLFSIGLSLFTGGLFYGVCGYLFDFPTIFYTPEIVPDIPSPPKKYMINPKIITYPGLLEAIVNLPPMVWHPDLFLYVPSATIIAAMQLSEFRYQFAMHGYGPFIEVMNQPGGVKAFLAMMNEQNLLYVGLEPVWVDRSTISVEDYINHSFGYSIDLEWAEEMRPPDLNSLSKPDSVIINYYTGETIKIKSCKINPISE